MAQVVVLLNYLSTETLEMPPLLTMEERRQQMPSLFTDENRCLAMLPGAATVADAEDTAPEDAVATDTGDIRP